MKKIKVAPSLPENVEVNELGENRSEVIAYPFESGYAITLAHPSKKTYFRFVCRVCTNLN